MGHSLTCSSLRLLISLLKLSIETSIELMAIVACILLNGILLREYTMHSSLHCGGEREVVTGGRRGRKALAGG